MTALITGATRGIGYAVAHQLAQAGQRILLTGRDRDTAARAAQVIQADTGGEVLPQKLDVADAESCRALLDALRQSGEKIDILINNAGIFPDFGAGFFDVDEATIRAEMEVHFFGAWRLTRELLPGMLARGHGRIVNLTSGYGTSGMGTGMTAYRAAKAAVNALAQIAAAEARGDVKVNAVDPGWVASDMGGEQAPRTPAEAAADVVHAATLGADGPNGVLLRHQRPADW